MLTIQFCYVKYKCVVSNTIGVIGLDNVENSNNFRVLKQKLISKYLTEKDIRSC